MINVQCECGWMWESPEAAPVRRAACPECGADMSLACAEELPDGAGAGDFDSHLFVVRGPAGRQGERIFLGGVVDITLGKADDRTIHLADGQASRRHCRLVRIDAGPSRWELVDENATNGTFVNGQRVKKRELKAGDVIRLGATELRFGYDEGPPPPPPIPAAAIAAGPDAAAVPYDGPACPSCSQPLARNARICVSCGIYAESGRPVLTAQGRDEDEIATRSGPLIMIASWFVWVTPLPIPISSEAFGRRKPYATWGIAALTVVVSLLFYFSTIGTTGWKMPGKQFMLWPTESKGRHDIRLTADEVREFRKQLAFEFADDLARKKAELRDTVPSDQLEKRAIEALINDKVDEAIGSPGKFEPYQLLTHALLHDTSGVLGFALHLGGNMLFLLVIGSRVNALLGNIAMLIVYPIMAIGAAALHLLMSDSNVPLVGASGAIMGMAGMYLVLFPAHRVYCAMWLRIRFHLAVKVFTLRGFWVLACYFAYDALMIWIQTRIGGGRGGGTAHWAHIGGAIFGITAAVGLLLSRTVFCGGADLFSVLFGKYAWGIVGKPSHWSAKLAKRTAPPAATAATAAQPA